MKTGPSQCWGVLFPTSPDCIPSFPHLQRITIFYSRIFQNTSLLSKQQRGFIGSFWRTWILANQTWHCRTLPQTWRKDFHRFPLWNEKIACVALLFRGEAIWGKYIWTCQGPIFLRLQDVTIGLHQLCNTNLWRVNVVENLGWLKCWFALDSVENDRQKKTRSKPTKTWSLDANWKMVVFLFQGVYSQVPC